jgi:hypothetical protein
MGMFDDIKCRYPLPVEGANALDYQTKDTPAQFCDLYEIREDGTLWREDYDTEDHSEAAKWLAANPGKELPEELNGLRSFMGCMTRVNKRWEQVPNFIGELRFYTTLPPNHTGWIEWSAYFEGGRVVRLNLVEHQKADAPNVPYEPRGK